LVVSEEGSIMQKPYEAGFYASLCVNSPYREFLKRHTQEVLETLPIDGQILYPFMSSSFI